MSIVTVADVGKYGVVNDIAPHRLPPEAWSSALNVRFDSGGAEKIGGEAQVLGTVSVDPLFLMHWNFLDTHYWVYASGAKVYRTDGTTNSNITRTTGGDYNGGTDVRWTGGVFGGILVLNNDSLQDAPQHWDGSANLVDDTNWPASTYCKVLRPFKNYLFAFYMSESGTLYPTKLRWSTEADAGSMPSTWVAAATNNAGSYTLSDTTGAIVDALALGDLLFIYKEDSTWWAKLVGGAFVFQTSMAYRTLGLLAVNCVTEWKKQHLCVTQGDVVIHDGTTPPTSIIDDLNRTYLFNRIDTEYKNNTVVERHDAFSEIWVCYPTAGSSGRLAEAAIWNTETKVWSFRELNDIGFVATGTVAESSGTTITDLPDPISDWYWPIGGTAQSGARQVFLMSQVGTTDKILQADSGYDFDGTSYDATLQRTGLAIAGRDRNGKVVVDPTQIKYVRELYPRVTAPIGTTIKFRFGSQMYFDESVSWGAERTFTVGTDRKLNLDMSFVFFAIEVTMDTDFAMKFDGYDLDLEIIGRY